MDDRKEKILDRMKKQGKPQDDTLVSKEDLVMWYSTAIEHVLRSNQDMLASIAERLAKQYPNIFCELAEYDDEEESENNEVFNLTDAVSQEVASHLRRGESENVITILMRLGRTRDEAIKFMEKYTGRMLRGYVGPKKTKEDENIPF